MEYTEIWDIYFTKSLKNYNLRKPLTIKILKNTNHPITKFLLHIHSLETFLYKDLKKASIDRNESKIMSLGPYALVLSLILN